jgi:hypothetical protein
VTVFSVRVLVSTRLTASGPAHAAVKLVWMRCAVPARRVRAFRIDRIQSAGVMVVDGFMRFIQIVLAMHKRLSMVSTMNLYVFLVCKPDGLADFSDIIANSSAEAVRALVAKHPNCRFSIINVTKP